MERDIWLEHMESRCGCNEDGFEDDDTDAGERGFSDKPVPTTNPNDIGTSVLVAEECSDRLHQMLELTWDTYFGVNLAVRTRD